jgi:hypothetical protein
MVVGSSNRSMSSWESIAIRLVIAGPSSTRWGCTVRYLRVFLTRCHAAEARNLPNSGIDESAAFRAFAAMRLRPTSGGPAKSAAVSPRTAASR